MSGVGSGLILRRLQDSKMYLAFTSYKYIYIIYKIYTVHYMRTSTILAWLGIASSNLCYSTGIEHSEQSRSE